METRIRTGVGYVSIDGCMMFKPRIPSLVVLAIAAATLSAAWAAGSPVAPDESNGRDAPPARIAQSGDAAEQRNEPEEAPTFPFWTKYAYFVPSSFGELPGWNDDDLSEAWNAFRQSCNALAGKPAWSGPCARSSTIGARDGGAIRAFLEREFALYEIRNTDRSAAGVITGYYEPLLHGSRQYGPKSPYPVYGVPDDLLYLDARSLPATYQGTTIRARIDGKRVVPACVEEQGGGPCLAPFKVEVGDAKPDIRDKRLRVRIDGNRVVPYYTRAEIERGALSTAGVLVWVDDIAALYSMQVQGSGRVRMPDGQIVRLAFAEQNGHPFTPPVRPARQTVASARPVVLTRGIAIPLSADEADADADDAASDMPARAPLTRSLHSMSDPDRDEAPLPDKSADDEKLAPEVQRMVELLLKGTDTTGPQHVPMPPAPKVAAPNRKRQDAQPQHTSASSGDGPVAKWTGMETPSNFSSDPSYTFFRQIPDSDSGPVGALGVPLTPGRSLAVDPRTTPLGSPVFISTEGPGSVGRLNRLMLAQDTGGAIRGAVRADYFWGFGPSAGDSASRMKEMGRMWLLLPKDQRVPAAAAAIATRGIGGPGPSAAECVIPDPDLCVE
jgi:membrane-bound lytic murein transglycosylase A